MPSLSRGVVAEFIGTFFLVFVGCASIILSAKQLALPEGSTAGTLVAVALAHGLILTVMVTACMYVSGAQFNPAVSIALAIIGKQPVQRAAAFVVAQLIAAATAAGMLQFLLTPDVANDPTVQLGATIGVLTKLQNFQGVVIFETIATFALMTSILMGTVDARAHKLGGFTIGLTIAALILAIGPLTGASMNPARTFGPAICGNHWDMHLAYWLGPCAGAAAAALVYKAVWEERKA